MMPHTRSPLHYAILTLTREKQALDGRSTYEPWTVQYMSQGQKLLWRGLDE